MGSVGGVAVQIAPFWLSAFLDLEPAWLDAGTAFWTAATAYSLSPWRGEQGEYATLVPPVGDDFLRVRRRSGAGSRIRLDLHVPDPSEAATHAADLGAAVLADHGAGSYAVLRSPGGLTFCLVGGRAAQRPPAARWPERSIVDQVCLDVPPSVWNEETRFWSEFTGWGWIGTGRHTEFRRLAVPAALPLKLLLQHLDEDRDDVRAHLDLACDDRAVETDRHVALGARQVRRNEYWTTLTDPAGLVYCLTDRRPD